MLSSTPPPPPSVSDAEGKDEVKYGSCLCKAIRYKVIGDPLTNQICNCTRCKKATGSAFMWNGVFEAQKIEIIQGEESVTKYCDNETRSGHTLERYFCKTCGSNVFLQPLRPAFSERGWRVVTLGSLDDPIDWGEHLETDVQVSHSQTNIGTVPTGEVFHERRVPYLEVIKFAPGQIRL